MPFSNQQVRAQEVFLAGRRLLVDFAKKTSCVLAAIKWLVKKTSCFEPLSGVRDQHLGLVLYFTHSSNALLLALAILHEKVN